MRDPVPVSDDKYFEKKEGIVTLQYPFEEIPVPDNGRYKLHNEIDDCIVCDKCAKVCPVNCIDIEPVRAVEEIGKTSDGTSKRIYAAKFDIDMSKCCFCGLCTTVCPTECLTMSKDYDFSVLDLKEHNFEFSEMDEPEIDLRKQELEVFNEQKAKAKAAAQSKISKPSSSSPRPVAPKPVAPKPVTQKPGFRPKVKSSDSDSSKKTDLVPKVKTFDAVNDETVSQNEKKPSAKPSFKPKIKTKPKSDGNKAESVENQQEGETGTKPPKPSFRPKIKPKSNAKKGEEGTQEAVQDDVPKISKPVFRPKIKKKTSSEVEKEEGQVNEADPAKPKPSFRPKIKAKKKVEETNETAVETTVDSIAPDASIKEKVDETAKKKPVFRPKIKPKK